MPGREIAGRPGGPYYGEPLKAAIASGAVPQAAVDEALRRILRQMDRFGLLGRRTGSQPQRIDIEADAKIVRTIAAQSAVLLKNDGLLPLGAADIASLAVIGPTGGQVAVGYMGERAYGFESRFVSPVDALRQASPRSTIAYAAGNDLTGEPIPASALSHGGDPGLLRTESTGNSRVDANLDFSGAAALKPGADYSWSGTLTVPEDGDYVLMVQTAIEGDVGGSGSIAVDGRQVVRSGGFNFAVGVAQRKWSSLLPTVDGRDNARAVVRLAKGPHPIAVSASPGADDRPLAIRFAWTTPAMRRASHAAAVSAAKRAKTAVVFAWSPAGSFTLPEEQDELIAAVAAANPRTAVVLNTGGPVAMPWKDNVRAVLEAWYPGQEGGPAIADLLTGRADPGGKLPVTFPVRIEDAPARAPRFPERMPRAGRGGGPSGDAPPAVVFSEGIFVGYRWYDQQGIEPLFPFGHGLSYTRFEYSALSVSRRGGELEIRFTLRNAGSRRGSEVAQVYLGPPPDAPIPMAPRALAAFRRFDLAAGAAATAVLRIPARALSYWASEKRRWVTLPGPLPVYVGSSSRDIRLVGTAR